MTGNKLPWTLTIPSDSRLLSLARAFIEAACQAAGFDRASSEAVSLATHEAVGNIIRHAHHGRPEASLQIQCFLSDDGIEVCLLDEGEPFDLEAVPCLDPGELRVGGRGVFLMRKLMDEVTSQPRGERGNTLRMVKRRPAPVAARDSA
jgi:serine/threonine-protein kinase RsbW